MALEESTRLPSVAPVSFIVPGHREGVGLLLGRHNESDVLGQVLIRARRGQGGAIVLLGEPGIGKTALIEDAVASAHDFRVLRSGGSEAEMELPFAALQRLCAPILDRLAELPGPQSSALNVAFGLAGGEPPDRLVVGLAVLTLLSELAAERPVICVLDDAQWLDHASAQALAFAGRDACPPFRSASCSAPG